MSEATYLIEKYNRPMKYRLIPVKENRKMLGSTIRCRYFSK